MKALDALGNPVRRALLERLRDGPCSVGELTAAVGDVSRPAVSRHLKVLAQAGLVQHEPQGTRNLYAVRREGFEPLRDYFERFWDDALTRYKLVTENLENP